MTIISHPSSTDDSEPAHATSPTAHALEALHMQGWRPHEDEPDPRPLPDGEILGHAISDVFDVFTGVLGDTRLEPDLPDVLWSMVNVFHRKADRVQRELGTMKTASASPRTNRTARKSARSNSNVCSQRASA